MNSKAKQTLLALLLSLTLQPAMAQVQKTGAQGGAPQTAGGADKKMENRFTVTANSMNSEKQQFIAQRSDDYRMRRGISVKDVGMSMLTGGATSVFNILSSELYGLMKIRSIQRSRWEAMRNKECVFMDSVASVKGQSDFYKVPSNSGPLDPSSINFDGVTIHAERGGQEVLHAVCHIDTTRIDHLFLHSKFYLVLDSVAFYPYHSFLPNIPDCRMSNPGGKGKNAHQGAAMGKQPMGQGEQAERSKRDKETDDYLATIRQFSFDEYERPTIRVRFDLSSSWINEQVQVYKDMHLGTFSFEIPVRETDVVDGCYIYSRRHAIATGATPIEVEGESFVVPRSYMPVSSLSPSWGTGEYKMKVFLSETASYKPDGERARHWHRDYKQLMRLQSRNGKAENEYVAYFTGTIMENKNTIIKSIYTPALNAIGAALKLGNSGMGGQAGQAAMGGQAGQGMSGAPAGQGMKGGQGKH